MSLYLEIILWWLFVPAGAIAICCGLVSFMDHCREQALLASLWDDELGVDEGKPGRGLTAIDDADPRPGSPSLCVGRTGQAGALTFPREWVTARARPYDQETS